MRQPVNFFHEQIEYFQNEMRKQALEKLQENNPKYARMLLNNSSIEEQAEMMLKEMEKGHFLPKYVENLQQISEAEQNFLYQQGYKDCMKFQRYVGAFDYQ